MAEMEPCGACEAPLTGDGCCSLCGTQILTSSFADHWRRQQEAHAIGSAYFTAPLGVQAQVRALLGLQSKATG